MPRFIWQHSNGPAVLPLDGLTDARSDQVKMTDDMSRRTTLATDSTPNALGIEQPVHYSNLTQPLYGVASTWYIPRDNIHEINT